MSYIQYSAKCGERRSLPRPTFFLVVLFLITFFAFTFAFTFIPVILFLFTFFLMFVFTLAWPPPVVMEL